MLSYYNQQTESVFIDTVSKMKEIKDTSESTTKLQDYITQLLTPVVE